MLFEDAATLGWRAPRIMDAHLIDPQSISHPKSAEQIFARIEAISSLMQSKILHSASALPSSLGASRRSILVGITGTVDLALIARAALAGTGFGKHAIVDIPTLVRSAEPRSDGGDLSRNTVDDLAMRW